jgi:hypothetical protein
MIESNEPQNEAPQPDDAAPGELAASGDASAPADPDAQNPTEEGGSEESFDAVQAADAEDGEGAFARGEALGPVAADRVAAANRATVVVLLGDANSGKTTLLASVYERFGLGKLGGHWFLGSRTLHGFELRCHRSLHGEGPGGGSGGHTAGDAPPWLHIRTARQEEPEEIFECLLGDFAGEQHSRPLADGSRKPSEFPALRRADHICVTVDGGKMARSFERDGEHRFILDLLAALSREPEALASLSAISFVVTKWDLVHQTGRDAQQAVETLFAELGQKLNGPFGYIETAARSRADQFPIGFGVADLLARWTDRPALHIRHPLGQVDPPSSSFYQFEAGR